jgi:hypothetical protein
MEQNYDAEKLFSIVQSIIATNSISSLPSPFPTSSSSSSSSSTHSPNPYYKSPEFSKDEIARLIELDSAVSVMSCSVLGSFLSQEVVKAVSSSGTPGFNVFVFSGDDYQVRAIPVQ